MTVSNLTITQITEIFTDIARRIPLIWRYDSIVQDYDFNFKYKINYYKEATVTQMTSGIERLKALTEFITLDDSRFSSMDSWLSDETTAIRNYIENYIRKITDSTYTDATNILVNDFGRLMYNCASGGQSIKSNNIIASGFITEYDINNIGSGTFSNIALTQLAKAGKIYRLECIASGSGTEQFSITEEGTGNTLALAATAGILFEDTEDYSGLVFQLNTTKDFAINDKIWIKIDGENNSWFMNFFVDYFQAILPNAASGAETIPDSLINLMGVS